MSDYKQTRDAAGKVTTQYGKMLRSLGDDDLVKQLRDPPVMSMAMNKGHLYGMMAEKMEAAADRIEELEADRAKGQADYCALMDRHDAQFVCVEELKQKLAKTVEALEKLARLGNGDRYGNSDGNMIARTTLAELKGETDD